MKKILSIVLLFLIAVNVNGQVRIGGTIKPTYDAILDLNADSTGNANTKGLILPRVALSAANNKAPMALFKAGMLVYNTATAGESPNNVTPGTYYCNGSKWVRVSDGVIANGSITNAQLAGSITGAKLTDATITSTQLANNAVVTTNIANAAVTNDKLAKKTITGTSLSIANLTRLGINGVSDADAIGAMVWNTNGAFPIGMYYWDGNKWNLISQNASTSVTPVTAINIRPTASIEATFTDTVNVISFIPAGATNKSVTWTVTPDTAVTIVSQTGTGVLLQAFKTGGAKLIATAAGTSIKDTTLITVTPHVACPTTVVGRTTTNTYQVGDFGLAGCWTTENLRDSTNTNAVRNGNVAADDYNAKAYYYPNNDPSLVNVNRNGLLYTWAAATDRINVSANEGYPNNNNTVQGICPTGWHIPSDKEWSDLKKVIANDAYQQYSTSTGTAGWNDAMYSEYNNFDNTIGLRMKDAYITSPRSMNGTANSYNNPIVGNRGFAAVAPGIIRAGAALLYGFETFLWSASSASTTDSFVSILQSGASADRRWARSRTEHCSVRCKKN
jgi:uncharacterized protein (TIGR02145 family)